MKVARNVTARVATAAIESCTASPLRSGCSLRFDADARSIASHPKDTRPTMAMAVEAEEHIHRRLKSFNSSVR